MTRRHQCAQQPRRPEACAVIQIVGQMYTQVVARYFQRDATACSCMQWRRNCSFALRCCDLADLHACAWSNSTLQNRTNMAVKATLWWYLALSPAMQLSPGRRWLLPNDGALARFHGQANEVDSTFAQHRRDRRTSSNRQCDQNAWNR